MNRLLEEQVMFKTPELKTDKKLSASSTDLQTFISRRMWFKFFFNAFAL